MECHWVYQPNSRAGPCSGVIGQHKTDFMFLCRFCFGNFDYLFHFLVRGREREREREWSWMRRGCELLGGVVVEIIRSSILYEENLWIKESILKWQSYSGSICSDLSYFCLVPVEIWKNSSLQSFCTPSTPWINKKGHGRWGIKVVRKRNQRSTPPPASSPPLPRLQLHSRLPRIENLLVPVSLVSLQLHSHSCNFHLDDQVPPPPFV